MEDVPQNSPASESRLDVLTVLAVGVIAYVAANIIHEDFGHGGVCLLLGGRLQIISSTFVAWNEQAMPWWSNRLIDAAGPCANLVAGLICFALRRHFLRFSAAWRYLLWLSMSVNLLQAGGYTMVSPCAGFGDWMGFMSGLEPLLVWKIGLTLCGLVVSLLALWLGMVGMLPFLGDLTGARRARRAWSLTLLPYLAGSAVVCIAGMLNPAGAHLVWMSAAASTLAGTCWLLWLPFWVIHIPPTAEPPLSLPRQAVWIVVGAVIALLYIAILGPSVHLSR